MWAYWGSPFLGLVVFPGLVCVFPWPGLGSFPSLSLQTGFQFVAICLLLAPHDASVVVLDVIPEAP